MTGAEQVALLKELRGWDCRCGDGKTPNQVFCRTCYAKLPRANQLALYRRLGGGYEEAYTAAVDFLDAYNATAKLKNDAKIAALRGGTQ